VAGDERGLSLRVSGGSGGLTKLFYQIKTDYRHKPNEQAESWQRNSEKRKHWHNLELQHKDNVVYDPV